MYGVMVALDENQWRALVNTALKILVPYKAGTS
jgi:hypothetical protein